MIAAGLFLLLSLSHCRSDAGPAQAAQATSTTSIYLMTSLPIVWGDDATMENILSGDAEPAPVYRYWQHKYDIEPVDSLEGLASADPDVLLLAQPRAMAPADLADLDSWVRGGGYAVILTDPLLLWPTELPIGDPRRPLSTGLLSPLLGNWGLTLVARQGAVPQKVEMTFDDFVVSVLEPGSFESSAQVGNGATCRMKAERFIALCEIGSGRAVLVADADLLHESLWSIDEGEAIEEADTIRFLDMLIASNNSGNGGK